jgi:hypothetical protein
MGPNQLAQGLGQKQHPEVDVKVFCQLLILKSQAEMGVALAVLLAAFSGTNI